MKRVTVAPLGVLKKTICSSLQEYWERVTVPPVGVSKKTIRSSFEEYRERVTVAPVGVFTKSIRCSSQLLPEGASSTGSNGSSRRSYPQKGVMGVAG